MQITRKLIISIPKEFDNEIQAFMKPEDTKNSVYSSLLAYGLYVYGEKKSLEVSLAPKSKCKSRELYITSEVADTLKLISLSLHKGDMEITCLKLIRLGMDSYKESEKEDSPNQGE